MKRLKKFWDWFLDWAYRLQEPEAFRELRRESKEIAGLTDPVEKAGRLWDYYKRMANGFAICATYGPESERKLWRAFALEYEKLCGLQRELFYTLLDERRESELEKFEL